MKDHGPHPRNAAFHWYSRTVPRRRVTAAQALQYDAEGFFVLRGAFTPDEVAEVRALTDPLADAANSALRDDSSGQVGISRADGIVFRPHLVACEPELAAFSRHRVFVDLVHDLVGDDVRLYWDQLVYKYPGMQEEFPWHQDNGYTFIEPQQYLTCWVALSPATVDNGCPWVVPGVHVCGTLRHRWTDLGFECLREVESARPRPRPLPLAAGDIAVFSSLTPHRTGPNLTDEVRRSYILQYAPDGATVYPHGGGTLAADAPQRQYLVLKERQPCQ